MNIQMPTSVKTLVPEPQSGFPSILPTWFRQETGLLDFEAQDLSRQVKTLARPGGRTALAFELLPGDRDVNWPDDYQRVELWPSKDGDAELAGTICMSWKVPDPSQFSGLGWAWPFQYHVGPSFKDGTDEGGLGTGVSFLNGQVGVYNRYQGTKTLFPLEAGRELFAQLDYKQAASGGYWIWRFAYDAPPAADVVPSLPPYRGNTAFGPQMYPKVGLYTHQVPQKVAFTLETYARRASAAEAHAAAGWGGTAPTPPPAPTVHGSIRDGQVLTGSVEWTADNGPVDFTIDGVRAWHENNPPYTYGGDGAKLDTTTLADGPHTFGVALSDGSAIEMVSATVSNTVTPPPVDPCAQVKAELAATQQALTAATTTIEEARDLCRQQIQAWRTGPVKSQQSWAWIKKQPAWAAYLKLGGS